jgi:hypothetical protein
MTAASFSSVILSAKESGKKIQFRSLVGFDQNQVFVSNCFTSVREKVLNNPSIRFLFVCDDETCAVLLFASATVL